MWTHYCGWKGIRLAPTRKKNRAFRGGAAKRMAIRESCVCVCATHNFGTVS